MGIRKHSISYMDVVRIEPYTTPDVMWAMRKLVDSGRQFTVAFEGDAAIVSAPKIDRSADSPPVQPDPPQSPAVTGALVALAA